jgi:heme/copper-type cytochrome/quinol oxidase subunit 2
MTDTNNEVPIKTKPLAPAFSDREQAAFKPSKDDLALQNIKQRSFLFWFVIIASSIFFILYAVAFCCLFFKESSAIMAAIKNTPLALLPLNLLIIAPVTMIIALLYKIYRSGRKTDEADTVAPQLDVMEKTSNLFFDMFNKFKDITK